ncbi:hypothetical protein GCM10020331_098470 [Ectobacillus funiculus]
MVLVIIYTVILVYDVPKLKQRGGRIILVYTLLMMAALYQSIIFFVFDLEWPFVHTAYDAIFFGDLASRVVAFF